ncbi:hypothetical protein J7F03_07100 [Streptomyces sp. ISL-43]|uniref:hypothetical protein n=1 Tax=Streptomyces sp. ISL-43 TaxID=2819183 RepID=UPI001BEC19B4|nr:hypothetical protein [Streptomyces sp. ISL-43]MBT2446845.1 hypothetical protein [Streptomyces sp. ISL-43]
MTESGQGGSPQAGVPWGPPMPAQPPTQPPAQPDAQPEQPQGQPSYGYPAPGGPAYGYPQGHVVGPGYEGPGDPHGYGYPPLPEAVTQYIPPVPAAPSPGEPAARHGAPASGESAAWYAAPGHQEAATQYIAPVPAAPGHQEAATQYIAPVPAAPGHQEAATQYIAPVPAAPGHQEAATQYIAPVPAAASHGESGPQYGAPAHDEAATQYIAPVPAAPADPAAGFDGLFRGDTQQLPPVQEPVLRQPPPRPYPQRQQHAQQPHPQQQYPHPQQQFQQQHPHPPHPQQGFQQPAPAPRKVSPAIVAAVVIGLAVAGLGVGALLSDGKAQNNDPGAVGTVPSAGGSAAPVGEAPLDPAQPQAVQLDKLLADSNDSRASVIKAVDDVKGCRNLDQAANDLRGAARQREELVTRLQELKVDQLPDHAKLTAALTKAWKSSAEADNSYASWADDVKGDGEKCKDGKAKSTDNASAGNKASGDATKAKESAAGMWNAIAGKYNLTKRDKSQL